MGAEYWVYIICFLVLAVFAAIGCLKWARYFSERLMDKLFRKIDEAKGEDAERVN